VGRRLITALALTLLLAACATKRTLVVLLPDEGGKVGRAAVSNRAGAVDLADERSAVLVRANQRPERIPLLSEADVTRRFGSTLEQLPAAPVRFTVYFQFDSDALTDESRRLVPTVLSTVRDRAAREVIVVGHTDAMGSRAENYALGLKRAGAVRNLLLSAGLDKAIVDVTSLGETDPVVATPNGRAEPRNRRVEIVVHPRQD
jgi:outer membrane protein OmpA-like peptidoglycan-associated protein